ncbi:MAG: hypothetical protein M0035_16535 [Actinomycetota bacterium]|jgi:hypothetical protein|nr:hypothetical protein [Actinomycetota bacterium]
MITALVGRRLGAFSRQAVCIVLVAFTKGGLLRRIESAISPALCELRIGRASTTSSGAAANAPSTSTTSWTRARAALHQAAGCR